MQTQVKALPTVLKYFNDLIDILYKNDYFGFEEDSIKYVTGLFEDIKKNLPTKTRKPAPEHFMKFGKDLYYAKFKTNRHTMWYVFFTIHYDNVSDMQTFLIRYVSNNHIISQYINHFY